MQSFSDKFTKKEVVEEEGDAAPTNKRVGKQNLLHTAKTASYVDDESLYIARISTKKRLEYWAQLILNDENRTLRVPSNFKSWLKADIASKEDKWAEFPVRLVKIFSFITSNRWDQWFNNFFILWLLIVIFVSDGWAAMYGPMLHSVGEGIALLPIFAMMITQLVPFFGTIYFIHHCNDLVHYSASISFGKWAFAAALTAQYIEYFYYGGRGNSEAAGRCAYGQESHPANRSLSCRIRDIGKKFASLVKVKKDAKIADIEAGLSLNEENELSKGENSAKSSKSRKDLQMVEVKSGEQDEESTVGVLNAADTFADEAAVEVVEHVEWVCVVCGVENRQPRHPEVVSDLVYGTRGELFKRPTVKIQPRRDMPACRKCLTYMDYTPPAGSAHLFQHQPTPFEVFRSYPVVPRIQAGLKDPANTNNKWAQRRTRLRSFLFGLENDSQSAVMPNDWRLKMYVNDKFPEMFRSVLGQGERYKEGELVECMQQKTAWCRGRVVNVRSNETYDIKYDTGDEVRFVSPQQIRLLAEKKSFAYRVELGMVLLVVSFPLWLLLAVTVSPGLLCLGLLLVSVTLLAMRMWLFLQYSFNYSTAGVCQNLLMASFFSLPLLMVVVAAAMAVAGGMRTKWTAVVIVLVVAKLLSLPALFMMRPTFAFMGMAIFPISSIGLYLLAALADASLPFPYKGAIAVAPVLILVGCIKYIRNHLHNIWDVCLIIRPERDISFSNVSLFKRIRDHFASLRKPSVQNNAS